MTVSFGAHVDQEDPLAAAMALGASLSQFFLGNPQGWKTPTVGYAAGPDALKADAAAAGIDLYVHAPYVLNVATTNNRVRIPSRQLLQKQIDLATAIGAKAIIVHGGHVGDEADLGVGFDNWRKCIDGLNITLPLLIENTAGGDHAMARHFDTIARLWEHIGDKGIGFCLDTCHAWAAGEELIDAVERIKSITGRIDLVHCNDSRDAAGSGADRHANFGAGQIDPQLLVAVVKAADAPVICETADQGRKDDIAFLREHTG